MKNNNPVGIIQNLKYFFDEAEKDLLAQMIDSGIQTVQVLANDESLHLMTEENAEMLLKTLDGKIRITSFWGGWSGKNVWNFTEGPTTLGLVPLEYRKQRMIDLKNGANFAKTLGVHNMATHVGFIPENPCDSAYAGLVDVIKEIADYCGERDLFFNFETGQETPVALMRLFSDVGRKNLGVNLDPANLVNVHNEDPVQAVYNLKDYIVHTHAKDGRWIKKSNPEALYLADIYNIPPQERGHYQEVPLGEGFVRLYPPSSILCLAEGVETALAVHCLTGLPVWSALSLSGFHHFEAVPAGVEVIKIYGDNDASFAGAAGAYELAARLRRSHPELRVEVHIPEGKGEDWNDVLSRRIKTSAW